MITNDIIQEDLITLLKANTALTTELTSQNTESGEKQIKEDQYQGTLFEYPAVRVDIQRQDSLDNADQCDNSVLIFSIRCYAEDASSKRADVLAGLVNAAIHRQELVGAAYKSPRMRNAGLLGAIRTDEELWMSTNIYNCNIYPFALP